ncbi:hypothetical protein EDB80DRAFT_595303 [Ilyonectria destructans]|nr:hypothetical protein EDB80DRAFT_595303 [Ilyonectria destructans]
MCFFEQTRWACGYWKWGIFREQCNKEHRIGETCGLRLIYKTKHERTTCKICQDMSKKNRRLAKTVSDIQRWRREGTCPATRERAEHEVVELQSAIFRLLRQHRQDQKDL